MVTRTLGDPDVVETIISLYSALFIFMINYKRVEALLAIPPLALLPVSKLVPLSSTHK